MLSIDLFRNESDKIRADHDKRGLPHDRIDQVIDLDQQWRNALKDMEDGRRERNQAAKGIAEAKKSGNKEEADRIMAQVKDLGDRISALDEKANSLLEQRDSIRMRIPNLLHQAVPVGDDESGNTQHSLHGEKPEFTFEPRTHNELIEMNKWVDLERAAKIAGSRFFFLKGDLARLELALQSYAVDFLVSRGFTFVQPPVMMNRDAYEGVTDLSDFETVMYGVEPDKLYMIATSEHPLTSMYMDEVIEPSLLPIKIVGVSPCFRRESGSYGKDTRGLLRLHQFNKVEMVKFVKPGDSYKTLEELTLQAESILQKLGITYRVVELCTGDLSFAASKCYDIEIWSPGEKQWLEVSSCSNFEDFQSRRGKIRYRREEDKKVDLLHTLNGSGLATPRLMVALLETYQTQDGRIKFSDSAAEFIGINEI